MISRIHLSPSRAAALWVLGRLRSDELPLVGIDLLENGFDGRRLRILAGLDPNSVGADGREAFLFALHELGVPLPEPRSAMKEFVILVSEQILSGSIEPLEAARTIMSTAIENDYVDHDFDPFVYIASEYEERPEDRAFFEASVIKLALAVLQSRSLLVPPSDAG